MMLISVAEQANEEIRLRHRYLDLRRPILTANIKKRSDVAQIVRSVFQLVRFDLFAVVLPIKKIAQFLIERTP